MKRFLVLLMLFGASAAHGEIYTWKDAKGTVFYTNSLNEIPTRHLKKARVLDVATGKKAGPAVPLPGTQSAPPASPVQASMQTSVQTPAPQAPAPTPVATPSLPVSGDGIPAVANPAPSQVQPAVGVTVQQLRQREIREQRRAQRRRDRAGTEDE